MPYGRVSDIPGSYGGFHFTTYDRDEVSMEFSLRQTIKYSMMTGFVQDMPKRNEDMTMKWLADKFGEALHKNSNNVEKYQAIAELWNVINSEEKTDSQRGHPGPVQE